MTVNNFIEGSITVVGCYNQIVFTRSNERLLKITRLIYLSTGNSIWKKCFIILRYCLTGFIGIFFIGIYYHLRVLTVFSEVTIDNGRVLVGNQPHGGLQQVFSTGTCLDNGSAN